MAQENFNVSLPNDGLGDALRDAFIKQQSMNTELYTTKVDKVVGKDLSTNDFTNALKTKLDNIEEFAEVNVQPDWLQNDVTADDYIKNKPEITSLNPDGFIVANYTLVDQDFTINEAQWFVNGQLNILPSTFPALSFEIPLAGAGLQRLDLFYGTNVGTIERIEGVESETAVEPTLPPNSVRLTVILTTDAGSDSPPLPDLNGFIQKTYFDYGRITAPTRDLIFDGRTNFWFNTTLPVFKGFNGSVEMFRGKRFIIRNLWTEDTLLEADNTVEFTFFENYILKAGESLEFDLFQAKLRLVGVDSIPRKGTADGAPITGVLEFTDGFKISVIDDLLSLSNSDNSRGVSANGFYNNDFVESFFANFGFSTDGLSLSISGELNPLFKGINVGSDFSEVSLSEIFIFAQRSYVLGVEKSANFTAQANGRYRTTATLTITDPTSGNYFVMVEAGVCTIGGVNYVAGDWVWRVGSVSYKINGGGSSGVTVHNDLTNRDASNAHPMSAITGLLPTETTATEITFTSRRIHGSFGTPLTNATFTTSLANAILNLEQKVYHQAAVEPDYPVGFVKVGGVYVGGAKNMILFEWVGGTRVEFYIVPA